MIVPGKPIETGWTKYRQMCALAVRAAARERARPGRHHRVQRRRPRSKRR